MPWDAATNAPAVPNGTMGHRYSEGGQGTWNLELGDLDPALSLLNVPGAEPVEIALPCFEDPRGEGTIIRPRGCRRCEWASTWSPPCST